MNPSRWSASGVLSLGFVITSVVRVVASDPEKDPAGWNDLKFGMPRNQVIEVLNGAIVDPDAPPKKESLFGLSSVLDIPALRSACEEILADSKENETKYDPELLEQCRDLKRALAVRQWKTPDQKNPKAKRTISGRLAEIVPSGQFGGGNDVILATKTGREPIPVSVLGPADKKVLETAYDIANDLSDYYTRTGTKPVNVPAVPRTEAGIPPRQIEIAGVEMKAEFTFSAGGLSGVRFKRDYAGEGGGSTFYDSYVTICRLLAEKYGSPDEQVGSSEKDTQTWRFPKTVIIVKRYRVRVPDSNFVRAGISVSYDSTSAVTSVPEKDKL